jgi:hypothetical protein
MYGSTFGGRSVLVLTVLACAFALTTPAAAHAEPGWSGTLDIQAVGPAGAKSEVHQVFDGVAQTVSRDHLGRAYAWSQKSRYTAAVDTNAVFGCDGETYKGSGSGTMPYLISFLPVEEPDPFYYFIDLDPSAPAASATTFSIVTTFVRCGRAPESRTDDSGPCWVRTPTILAPDRFGQSVLKGEFTAAYGSTDWPRCGTAQQALQPTYKVEWSLTRLPDQDCDGIPDSQDPVDTDGPCGNDRDGDGLTNAYELTTSHTDPDDRDTDDDGLNDADEVFRGTNPNQVDTDGDGLGDGAEVFIGTNPKKVDTDGDHLNDGDEVSRGTDPKKADTDGDGLNDGNEVFRGTDPANPDTDGGGVSDGVEVFVGTNPLDERDDRGSQSCSTGKFVNPTYTGRVPGVKLFTFQPSYTFCYGDRIALIRRVNIYGDVIAGAITRTVLEKLGFTLEYAPPTEAPRIDRNTASAAGGLFSIAYDGSAWFDRFGLRGFVEKRLGKKLKKVIAKNLKKYGPSYRELRAIREAELEVRTRVLLEVDKHVRRVSRILPDGLATDLRGFVRDKVKAKLDSTFDTVNASISPHGSADEISEAIVDGVIRGLNEAVTWHFPVWEPEVRIEVFPGGIYSDSADDPFQNPFLIVSKTP